MADFSSRFINNPILTPSDIQPSMHGMKVQCLLNPGAFRYDGKIWLILRVAERPEQKEGKVSFPILGNGNGVEILEFDKDNSDIDLSDSRYVKYKGITYLTTLSHLRLVCSTDGVNFHEPEGMNTVISGFGNLESFGIEDCRVSKIDNTFYLTYTQVSNNGIGIGLMSTDNWQKINRHGMIFPPQNKDCTLFEEKIDGQFYCLHRPSSVDLGGNYIWLSGSPDMHHWGKHFCILRTRENMWDSKRIGAGGPPIKTDRGWLEIYHGADHNDRYCLGAFLMDINDPTKVIARSAEPIMEPLEDYEKTGFFGNVVFTNGHLVDGDEITIYYGASDEVVCGAKFSINKILSSLSEDKAKIEYT